MPESQKKKDEGRVAEDQRDREYYYDDSHGYEEYDPEETERDEDDISRDSDDESNEGAK